MLTPLGVNLEDDKYDAKNFQSIIVPRRVKFRTESLIFASGSVTWSFKVTHFQLCSEIADLHFVFQKEKKMVLVQKLVDHAGFLMTFEKVFSFGSFLRA